MTPVKYGRSILISCAAAAAFLSFACTGDTGPAGPPGPEGPQGPAGSPNVIYSPWRSAQAAQRDTVIDGSNVKYIVIPAPELTNEILQNGVILVYMRFSTTIMPLPYTSDAGSGIGPDKANTVSFFPEVGRLVIARYTHDNTASIGFGVVQFRYVLIPGGVQAAPSLVDLDLRSYNAVAEALDLPN